jgi:hypothetical protein
MTTHYRSESPRSTRKNSPAPLDVSWQLWAPFYCAGIASALLLTSATVEVSPALAVGLPLGTAWLYVVRPWQIWARVWRRRQAARRPPVRRPVRRPAGATAYTRTQSTRTPGRTPVGQQKPRLRAVDSSDTYRPARPRGSTARVQGEPTVLAALLEEFRDLLDENEPSGRLP